MADIYGSHFEYGGIMSRQYGLIIANVDSERFLKLSGDITGITVFNKIDRRRYIVGDSLSDYPLSFEIEIITDDERCINKDEKRAIEKWLFNRGCYKKLYFDEADDCLDDMSEIVNGTKKRLYLNCRFVNPEKIEDAFGVIGYKATLEADSGMFWQDPTIYTYELSNTTEGSTSTISIEVDSDIDDYIYPNVTFTLGSSGGDVIIINNSDDNTRLTKFTGLSANATITMKGDINYISGQNYNKFSTRNFVRLLDGVNGLTVHGDVASITIEFQNRRNM